MTGDCPRALVVGYSPAQVNATDFVDWMQRIFSCPSGGSQVNLEIAGVSNLNVAYPYAGEFVSTAVNDADS